jgi:hypothetical protein
MERNASSIFQYPEDQWPANLYSCRHNLRIFIYQDLPTAFTSDIEGMINLTARVQENVATELALMQLFRTSACRTKDPSQADLFLVPYMHFSDCRLTDGYGFGCSQVADSKMNLLFKSLGHYNDTTKPRHLFINVYDDIMSKKQMSKVNAKLTSGPRLSHHGPGVMVVPIFNDDPRYQPSVLLSYNESWWTRPRKYAFTAFYGGRNPRMGPRQPRRFRDYFWKSVKREYPHEIGGLPYISQKLPSQSKVDMYAMYRDSVVCPILPGDNPWMRRFFDVIFSGCLPLVVEWPLSTVNEGSNKSATSWWIPGGVSNLNNHPFIKGLIDNNGNESNHMEWIDYDSFVVKAAGNPKDESNLTSILTAIESILNNPKELRRRQLNLMSYAPRLTYGLGLDAHKYDDAFSQIMRQLERYASKLP